MDINNSQKLIDILSKQQDLLISGHIDPDSDCVGTMLGFFHAMGGKDKNWHIVLQDDIPAHAAFMPGIEMILKPEEFTATPKAILLMDCNEASRAGEWMLKYWDNCPTYIIDHHPGTPSKAEITIVDTVYAAAGELVTDILKDNNIEFTKDAALCLYSAIAADTACFRYSNTTPHTLVTAAGLLSYGIDAEAVRINLFENLSRANIQTLSAALASVEYFNDGLLCVMTLPKEVKDHYNASKSDCSNIINYTLATKGVKVGILLNEYDDVVKVSLRCRNGYEVNKLAAHFGGGGHRLAAGCRIYEDLKTAKEQIVCAAEELIFHIERV